MQLKIKRSQKNTMLSGTLFCIDARLELTSDEAADVEKFKLAAQVIFSNQRRAQVSPSVDRATVTQVAGGAALAAAVVSGPLAPVALAAASALRPMNLEITFASLQKGHHIECKTLDEAIGVEGAIVEACQAANAYLTTARTFDGREVAVDFHSPPTPLYD